MALMRVLAVLAVSLYLIPAVRPSWKCPTS
jgi:hypothetical protein